MEYAYEIKQLSQKFYNNCKNNSWDEVLEKEKRAYNCIVVETFYDFFICIPFRTEMNHKNGYRFKSSRRSMAHKSGIDYSKMVLIDNPEYISNTVGIVDKDEYNEFVQNSDKIILGALNYLKDYIKYLNNNKNTSHKKDNKKFKYTSLSHFKDILEKYNLLNF